MVNPNAFIASPSSCFTARAIFTIHREIAMIKMQPEMCKCLVRMGARVRVLVGIRVRGWGD